jgi:hypothetical protein
MNKSFLSTCLIGLALWSCQPSTQKTEGETVQTETQTKFGVEVVETSALKMNDLEQKIVSADSINDITIQAKVVEVCQNAGCWMTLAKSDGSTMRVKFKDYKLFMPKDLAGKEVVIHGKAMKKEIPVSELQHYAADANKPKEEIEKITAPEIQLSFEADGVLIKG